MSKQAIMVLAEGFEEIEAITPVDVLRRAGVRVIMAGLDKREVDGAHGVVLRANTTLSDVLQPPDLLVLPGGMPGAANLGASESLKRLALEVKESGGILAAICAAPALTLAKWGLLDGLQATCYPGFEKDFPSSVRYSEERVVVDSRVVTSRGPGTALEFALTLAGLLTDEETAAGLRQGLLAG